MATPPDQQSAWEGFVNRWDIFEKAQDIVDQKFQDGRDYAIDALRTASDTIDQLKEIASTINSINVSTAFPYIKPPAFGSFVADKPDAPTLDIHFPAAPTGMDEMENAIHDKIISDIQDSVPAVTEEVQDAIFKKDTERAALVLNETLDTISDEWSKRGFTLPNAMLAAQLTQAVTEHGNKRTDVSRDIAIKTLELSDANMKFMIQQGIAFLLQRIEIYKAEIQAEIARIDAIVRKYLAEVDVYKGEAEVYTALANIEIMKFKSEVDYEVARANILIKNAEIDVKNFEVMSGLRVEAMKAIGSINAQIVAGALASVSASAYISASNSGDYNYNYNPNETED